MECICVSQVEKTHSGVSMHLVPDGIDAIDGHLKGNAHMNIFEHKQLSLESCWKKIAAKTKLLLRTLVVFE